MMKIYTCIATEHDLRLVVLAALVCALASFAAMGLLNHSRHAPRAMRPVWLVVAAIATGCGIWATHFIAMLAYSPGIANGYNIALTLLSLVAAIGLTGSAMAVAMFAPLRLRRWIGGAMVGGGIATMHYTGMAAFEIAGSIIWDMPLVILSIVLGAAIGATALPIGLASRRGTPLRLRLAGAGLLTLAICSHHFTAMGAVSIIPDPAIVIPESAISPTWLAVGVAFGSLFIIMFALTAVSVDLHERRRMELEAQRMQRLANAAIEGLMMCDGTTIVSVNDSLADLAAASTSDMIGTDISRWLPDASARAQLLTNVDASIETDLRKANGEMSPVELLLRPVDFGGRPHHAIAVRDLKARREAERHIRYLALHDALTQLPNRATFNNRLDKQIAAASKGGGRLAVLCLDLDRFKEVNDLYGHATGDRVLQTVASRVTGVLADGQMMARLGGDEFAVLVPDAVPATVGEVADRIQAAIAAGLEDGVIDTVQTSIGIAIFPDDATDRETLLTHADTALYRAKTEGRNTFRFFEAAMGAEVRDRRQMEHDLRQATARDELHLVYQPQTDIESGGIVGFEALLRWHHPVRGLVPPGVFIPIAEDSGAILQIGEWVLRTACREAASWPKPLTIAINVSAMQIYNEGFVQLVHSILLETGLSPARLELEITETAMVRDLQRALNALRQIKALGVRIAMDDFGTGYSSLSNLRAFPFDKIKIDGSFVKSVNTNEQAATIVRAVLGLGRGLGLPVLAEGVETRAELAFLEKEQCGEVQGYFMGRPAVIETFRAITHGEPVESAQAELPLRLVANR
jgi:diguanylate cyclase